MSGETNPKYGTVKRQRKISKLQRKLTQSDLRILMNNNKVWIAGFEQDLAFAKIRECDLYHLSDKDNPETIGYFVELNQQKEYVRYLKNRIKQLKDIQRKLKLQMSDIR